MSHAGHIPPPGPEEAARIAAEVNEFRAVLAEMSKGRYPVETIFAFRPADVPAPFRRAGDPMMFDLTKQSIGAATRVMDKDEKRRWEEWEKARTK